MLVIISPAKTLDESPTNKLLPHTLPNFIEDAEILVNKLKKLSKNKLKSLMNISDKLAELNLNRYSEFPLPLTIDNSKQSVLLFKGDVYEGLQAGSFFTDELEYAQNHLRILSGLYGVLKPLDLIYPYRLEMGTKLKIRRANDLYQFWGNRITQAINDSLPASDSKILVNLASKEYSHSVDLKQIKAQIVTPSFKEERNGKFKLISFFAKKARGLMTQYIIKEQVSSVPELNEFNLEGYQFNEILSHEGNPVFTRKSKA